MWVRFAGAGAAALVPLLVLASPGFASRAELDARSLPRLLALDPTNVVLLPASLGGMPRQAELDYTTSAADRFAMGMAGSGTRFAYVLNGESHNLYLGGAHWGAILGFQDSYYSEEELRVYSVPGVYNSDASAGKQSRRTVRLGIGWQHDWGSDRVLQIGVGGSWIDAEWSTQRYEVDSGTEYSYAYSLSGDPGWGVDATLQFLGLRSGLLLALRYRYSDLSPDFTMSPPVHLDLRDRSQAASVDVGWRFRPDPLDDLVAGASFSWSEEWTPRDARYSGSLGQRDITLYRGAVFLSGEKNVWKGFTALGGVRGPVSFTQSKDLYLGLREGVPYTTERSEYNNGGVDSAEIHLGVTWAWRSLVLTAQIRESLNLDSPITRWAATLTY